MRKPIQLPARWTTLEEWEKHFRIPKARKKELQALVDEFKAAHSNQEAMPLNSIEPEKRRKSASAA